MQLTSADALVGNDNVNVTVVVAVDDPYVHVRIPHPTATTADGDPTAQWSFAISLPGAYSKIPKFRSNLKQVLYVPIGLTVDRECVE